MTLLSCNCSDHSGRFAADAVRRTRSDPTGTGKIRKKYEADIVRRFKKLRALIIEAIVELDVLGLAETSNVKKQLITQTFTKAFTPSRDSALVTDALPPQKAFAFSRPAERVDSFMNWLYEQQQSTVLGVVKGTPMARASATSWQNVYIDTAYKKGMRDAYDEVSRSGGTPPDGAVSTAFNQPIHADRVALVHTRAFNSLEGVTDTMASQIANTLALGVAQGKAPKVVARELAERVDKIGITRARVIARTETISAHAEGALNSYEEAGVEGVNVMAEFSTAGDDSVCPECEALEGKEFEIDEARGMIPVHPNCRCTYLPVVK